MIAHRYFSLPFAVLLLSTLPILASAHHSRSEFAEEVIEIEGELVNVIWRNPHAGLDVRVIDETGQEEVWRVETFGSPNLFSRMGVEESHFVVGEQIVVAGRSSTKRDNYFLGLHALFENGTEAVMSATLEPRWSQDHVGGSDQSAVDLGRKVDALSENKTIFRTWSIAGRNVGVARSFPYSDQARAEMAAWDPVDAPVNRCETPGMPITMVQPLSFKVEDLGSHILLTTEYFGVERTIYMEGQLPSTDLIDTSIQGLSIGRWEDESTFIVQTTDIDYPYFNSAGALQSAELRTTEYFELNSDQSELQYRIEMQDPTPLNGTAYSERLFVALGEEFVELDCTLF